MFTQQTWQSYHKMQYPRCNFTLAVQRVREVVDALPEEDAALLRALYLQTPPLTMRAYSEKTGIPVMTLHYRKEKLLRLLKQQI